MVKVKVKSENQQKVFEMKFKIEPLFRFFKEIFSSATMPSQQEILLDCGDSERRLNI